MTSSKISDDPPLRTLPCVAFEGYRCIAMGELEFVARKVKEVMEKGEIAPIIILEEATSRLVEVDFRGSADEVVGRFRQDENNQPPVTGYTEKRGIGRPKLGVVAREVTLLPRHWEWLNRQPGGASVALRKLVEEARRSHQQKDRARESQESVHRFLSNLAGNLPGFEEALRAFYSKHYERFHVMVDPWPQDIRDHARKLAATAIRDEAALPESAPRNPAAHPPASAD